MQTFQIATQLLEVVAGWNAQAELSAPLAVLKSPVAVLEVPLAVLKSPVAVLGGNSNESRRYPRVARKKVSQLAQAA
jgi:hypothetical protein